MVERGDVLASPEEEEGGGVAGPRARGCFGAPIRWLRMLSAEMHWSFVLGVVLVYGVSQGLGGALSRVATEYYMKDVQEVQPSEAQIYSAIINVPWLIKPIWGLLTDVVPVGGYRRRPYFVCAVETNHTTELELHGRVGMVSQAILDIQHNPGATPSNGEHWYQMFDFCKKSIQNVKDILRQYREGRRLAGYIM